MRLDPGGRYHFWAAGWMAFLLGALACRGVESPGFEVANTEDGVSVRIVLKKAASNPETRIQWTSDGSQPTAVHGTRWIAGEAPLNFRATTVLRAVAIQDNQLSPVATRTVLIPRSAVGQRGESLPASWGRHEGKPLPSSYTLAVHPGIPGADQAALESALTALPSISLVVPPEDLWSPTHGIYLHPEETGEGWERTASFEWFSKSAPDAKPTPIGCGLRIQGGWSRRPEESPKHSFRLLFRKRYGTAHLRIPLFGPEPEEFSTLILRGGNNNTWLHPATEERRRAEYLRDSWMRATYDALGHPSARGRFVHLYLNGLYWGIYQATERPDATFSARVFGGSPADYDSRNSDKVIAGDEVAWKQLFAVVDPGVHSDAEYERVGQLLDLPSFIDFILVNLYGANGDWDRGSNWYATRRRTPAGGYRFLEWDGERTLEAVADNQIGTDDDESPMRLFQRLRKWPPFVKAFSDRARVVMASGGPLSPEAAALRYRRLAQELEPAMAAEAARWGTYRRELAPFRTGPFEVYTRETHWKPEIKRLLNEYFPARTEALRRQLTEAGFPVVP
jgi:hypothetical protein